MRLTPTLLALLVSLAAGPGWADQAAKPVRSGCDLVPALLDQLAKLGRPLVFDSQEPMWEPLELETPQTFIHRAVLPPPEAPEQNYDEAYGWLNDPPSLALATRFLARRPARALTACPNLREEFKRRNIAIDAKVSRKPEPGGFFAETSFRLSAPVTSDDGQDALIVEEVVSGPLAAGGLVVHLRRDSGGAWRVVDQRGTWIS